MIARAQLRALRQSAEARLEADGRGRQARRLDTLTSGNLHDAVNVWASSGTHDVHGDISGWDTSRVDIMASLFSCDHYPDFNEDISGWDTSRVTQMYQMFRCANSFDQAIGGWDTSKVEQMDSMFREAAAFNQDIGDWDVSKVQTLQSTFESASVFNQNIDDWGRRRRRRR
jgi:surface protein